MIDLIWAAYRDKVQELRNNRQRKLVESKILEEASDLVTDRPDVTQGWVRRYAVNDWEKGHQQAIQFEAVRKSREFERFMPHAKGVVRALVNYIMGKGLTIQPKSEDPMVTYIWREFMTADRNKWQLKQFELPRRMFRDGEVFIRFYNKDENGNATGKTTIRFIDPLMVRHAANSTSGAVKDPSGQSVKNGVITEPEDVEEVIAYQVMHHDDQTKYDTIPAEEMYHIKINADSDQKRGEPDVQPLLQYFRHYEQWIENRIILNKMRTAIVLIKKVEGTPTEVANLARTLPTATRQNGNETKTKNFRGGTMITEGPGVTYRMESPNINAQDVKEDGRNIILAMAAGMNTPEYIFGDASNANYASTMIAESPFVKMIQFWQVFLEYHLARIYKKVLQNAVAGGLLEEPSDDEFVAQLKKIRTLAEDAEEGAGENALSPKEAALKALMPNGKMETPTEIFYGIDVSWPEIVHRDLDKQAMALSVMRQNGWVSDPTAVGALGYDYSEEVRKQRKVEEDAEIEDNPLLNTGGMGDAGDMAGELNGMLDQLSPQERQTVLNSKDPEEIKAIMARHQSSGKGDNANGD